MSKHKGKADGTGDLFIEASGQLRLSAKSAEQLVIERRRVECLGLTFESEEARRAYFLDKLRQKLRDPEFRNIDGFPIGDDEDILALSDPPYYTACPNPFTQEFVRWCDRPYDPTEEYKKEPFAADVSEGKTDHIYNAHSYHTKVPHKAIMRYILHYTAPGDIVFDGFCGTGMTGVAAQACAAPDDDFRTQIEKEMPDVRWGARRCILADLSPAATFIAKNYNYPADLGEFLSEMRSALSDIARETAWLYETRDSERGSGEIEYAIWTDCFNCPHCAREFAFWDAAVEPNKGIVHEEFPCPGCGARVRKAQLERVVETYLDDKLGPARRGKYVLSVVNALTVRKRVSRPPSGFDLELLSRIEALPIPDWFPTDLMLFKEGRWGHMWRAGYHTGISNIHHFFTKRNLWALAVAWRRLSAVDPEVRHSAKYVFTGALQIASRMSQFRFDSRKLGNTAGGIMKGALFVPSLSKEGCVPDLLARRFKAIVRQYKAQQGWRRGDVFVGTGSCSAVQCPANSIDYIFVDPPFGANIMYSEVSFLWEAWLRVFTNNGSEAVINEDQKKGLVEYQRLMEACFQECFRILKPGRWMTIEFHNSKNSVWSAIQEALQRAGFVVADVRTLDKKQGSFKQLTTGAAVKQDLVISAYKPNGGLEHQFKLHAGTPEGAWDFVRQHLKQLPVFVEAKGRAETIAERQPFLLFDRMVAFHIQRGATVPLSAAEIYAGLSQKFPERDGMYFLADQVAEYDHRRLQVKELAQLDLFVSDERSAIQWLRQQLEREPQTYQEIQPKFLKELHQADHEQLPELQELLSQNFLEDEQLRWYVPDPNKQLDLDKLREKALLQEFAEYKTTKHKRLKVFRTEAVRAGFKSAWAAREYQTILSVAAKLPEDVLQEDQTILMYFDNASLRVNG